MSREMSVEVAGVEIVAHRRVRSLLGDHRGELTEFEDPLPKAGLL